MAAFDHAQKSISLQTADVTLQPLHHRYAGFQGSLSIKFWLPKCEGLWSLTSKDQYASFIGGAPSLTMPRHIGAFPNLKMDAFFGPWENRGAVWLLIRVEKDFVYTYYHSGAARFKKSRSD